ncbi:MAG: glycine oxidase ThiO [Thermaerobacter sp.]|nr:glycine oxidase ThiO [Thermaerobacter sp.]
MSTSLSDALIIGGGVVGTALAYELSQQGISVTLLEQNAVGSATSYGAAGMLPPQVEAHEPGALLDLALESFQRYPGWQAELYAMTGMSIDLDTRGIVQIAESPAGQQALRAQMNWQMARGLTVKALDEAAIRDWIPGLRAGIEFGLWTPGGQVAAPRLSQSLALAAVQKGSRILEGVTVTQVDDGGVDTTQGRFEAGLILIATGAWLSHLSPIPITPVKGQRLMLQQSAREATRITVFGESIYLVPKSGAHIFAGSTEEPRAGFDRSPTLAAILQVGEAARTLCPPLAEARLVEAWAGLRPCTADGLPVIGPVSPSSRVWVVGGHCRNGILLAPVTARMVVKSAVGGEPLPSAVRPDRFTGAGSRAPAAAEPGLSSHNPPVVTVSTDNEIALIAASRSIRANPAAVYALLKDFPAMVPYSQEIQSLSIEAGASPDRQRSHWVATFLGYPVRWVTDDSFDDALYAITAHLVESNFFDHYVYHAVVRPQAAGSLVELSVRFRLGRMRGLAGLPARQLIEAHLRLVLDRIVERTEEKPEPGNPGEG